MEIRTLQTRIVSGYEAELTVMKNTVATQRVNGLKFYELDMSRSDLSYKIAYSNVSLEILKNRNTPKFLKILQNCSRSEILVQCLKL